jgi:hypothetical protein
LSRIASASSFFSRRFSYSKPLSRFASDEGEQPPELFFR